MKKLLIIFCLTVIPSLIFGQAGLIGSLGIGGGLNFGYMNPGLKELNDNLGLAGFKKIEGGIFGYGGGLNILFGNYRLGYYAMSGKRETTNSLQGWSKNANIEYGYYLGMIGFEFLTINDFHVSLDVGLGSGYVALDLVNKSDQNINWNDVWQSYTPGSAMILPYNNSKLTTSFFQYQPSLVIEYIYGGFFKFYLAGDYIGVVKSKWYLNNDVELKNLPSINLNGYSIRLGINVGIFLTE